jgi:biopolymer transport protein TolR
MAGGMDLGTGGKGGRKPLDAAINLVPFIDLMAVTISFLIMTAVWTQITRLQVSQAGTSSTPQLEQDQTLQLSLAITEQGYTLSCSGAQVVMPKTGAGYDLEALQEKLRALRAQFPEQRTITVQSVDAVKYADLVQVIDACVGAGLDSVSVSAVS